MKNIIKIIFILTIGTFASCNDFLTIIPDDRQVFETYYIDDKAVDANTATLYSAYVWQDFHINFMWMAGDELSGDLFYTYAEEGQFYLMNFNSTNTFMTAGWDGLYRVVSYCNNIINNMPNAASANGVQEAAINRGLAEARCIRAFAYYFLTEYWKDVPIVTDNNMSGDDIRRNTQKSVYEFIRRDLEFAKEILPATPFQAGRVTKWTAEGMLAKLHLTMASHLDDANSAENFAKAKEYAADVINNSGLELYADLSALFYPAANNNSESLFAIQCTQDGYAYGNARNVSLSRNENINLGNSWGAGKGATLSLQSAFENGDARRKLTFMRNGDHYDNLAGGGYDYLNVNKSLSKEETANEMLNHVRKYIVGANADCGGKAGATNQDAGNNIYLLRLADVYLVYAEACIGAGTSTNDALALEVFNKIRQRAGLAAVSSITYDQLVKERRVEFAFESINFFDIKRMSYRNEQSAVDYLNSMERWKQYVQNSNYTDEEYNAANMYHGGFTPIEPEDDVDGTPFFINPDIAVITFNANQLVLPIPDGTATKTPNIRETPVDYDF
ncbi:MAG: RagB/SusD family nutrient uptake outer membrane protein [Prevotellaceae bacterium]|jgi:hypothetical protein|nr:RagB/SusD family nutrient uptake outer membrane protein [Prevotellaceae bacterium]